MYDLVVLGGGSGGVSAALAAARTGASVALIEKQPSNVEPGFSASVASKALVHAAQLAHQVRSASPFGIHASVTSIDFAAVMERVRSVGREAGAAHSADWLRARGVALTQGTPAFESYDTVVVDGSKRIAGERFVIATGSRPAAPEVPGLAEAGYLDSRSVWALSDRPETLVILGADPIGVELAQAFARLGSKVKLLTEADKILPDEDPEVSDFVEAYLSAEGLTIKTGVELTRVELRNGQKVVLFRDQVSRDTFEAAGTHLLVAGGRLANVEGLNLEEAGVHADPQHGIEVDEHLRTSAPRIFAIGDVLLRRQSRLAAEREAVIAFHNAVVRIPKRVDYETLPRATFIDPEVASVGLSEQAARASHADARVVRAPFSELDRAIADGRTDGFAKVVATPAGKILGATVVGQDAGMIVQELAIAMENGLTLHDVARTLHLYPTYAGMAGKLAGEFAAMGPDGGLVQTAVRWFRGFKPRAAGSEAGAARAEPAAATGPDHHGH